MNKQATLDTSLKIAIAAVFGALAATVTISFVIPIPATSGYFNLGEAIIYISALLFGTYVGTFTGASIAIADILVPGAAQFAPGTLLIKGAEGAIVSIMFKKLRKYISNTSLCASISIAIGGLGMVAGYFIYEQLFLSYPTEAALLEVPFNITQMIIGLIIAVPIMHVVQRVFPQLKR